MAESSNQRWKTAPLDRWQKCKELRVNHYKDVATARARGRLLISGGAASCETLPAGLGDYVFFCGEPYGASVSYDTPFGMACVEATEAHGFARDLCAYMRNYWGSMYLDQYLFGGPFPKPHFFLTSHECDSHAKWYQVWVYLISPSTGLWLATGRNGKHGSNIWRPRCWMPSPGWRRSQAGNTTMRNSWKP
ncbi:MAG: hypothetical protein Q7R34_11445 [Dehalococcoidia bacterium]|nr:hypothetical protein [Dehalococcoidia bacterium]